MKTFYHSGRIGDIIYSLPTIAAMGGGRLVTGLPFDAHKALAPLLWMQPCIKDLARIEDEALPAGFINLDQFRQAPGLGQIHIVNAHLRAFELPDYIFANVGWLQSVDRGRFSARAYAIINRTERYNDKFCRWAKELEFLRKRAKSVFFMGHPREFEAFRAQFGGKTVAYWPVSNLFDAAHVIAGAKYFSGCQSSLLAIRQGLGMPYRMEQSPNHQDCNQYSPQETIINPHSRKLHLLLTTVKKLIK